MSAEQLLQKTDIKYRLKSSLPTFDWIIPHQLIRNSQGNCVIRIRWIPTPYSFAC